MPLCLVLYVAPPMLEGGGLYEVGYDVMDAVFYPLWQARLLREGHLVLWNPWTDAGVPHAAALVGMVFSPLTYIPAGVGSAPWGIALGDGTHFLLGAIGLYLFLLRLLARSGAGEDSAVGAAAIGATGFLLSGWMMIHRWAGHATLVHAAVFVPWGLLAIDIGSRSGMALLGMASGMLVLSGGVDLLVIAPTLWTLYALLRPRERIPTLLAGGLLGLAFGAPQWMLTMDQLSRSLRADLSRAASFSTTFQLPPQHLVGILLPGAFGWAPDRTYYGAASFAELWAYPGIVALLLAGIGLLPPPRPVRREALLFAGLGILSLAVALGDRTPVYPLLLRLVPPIGLFRRPARWLFLLALAVPILAALGAARPPGARRARIGAAFLLVGGVVLLLRAPIGGWVAQYLSRTMAARSGGAALGFAPLVQTAGVQALLLGSFFLLPRRTSVLLALLLLDLGPWAAGLHPLRRFEEYLPREVPSFAREVAPNGAARGRNRIAAIAFDRWYPGYDVSFEVPSWMGGYALGNGRIDAARERASRAGPDDPWWDRTGASKIVLPGRVVENRDAEPIVRAGREEGRWIVGPGPNRFLAAIPKPRPGEWKIAVAWDPGWRAEADGKPAEIRADEDGMILARPAGPTDAIRFRFLPRALLPALLAEFAASILLLLLAVRRGPG